MCKLCGGNVDIEMDIWCASYVGGMLIERWIYGVQVMWGEC